MRPMAFGLEVQLTVTQVLCSQLRSNEVTQRHHSGKVFTDIAVADGVTEAATQEFVGQTAAFIDTLPAETRRGNFQRLWEADTIERGDSK